MELEYGLFMAERAGLLNTKESRLNRVCQELHSIRISNKWDEGAMEILVEQTLRKNELNWNELSYNEQRRVLDSLRQ